MVYNNSHLKNYTIAYTRLTQFFLPTDYYLGFLDTNNTYL